MQGTIQRVIRGKGFGFILADNRQYFFHHTEVQNTPFKRLLTGDVVEFQALDEDGEGRNPRATDVVVVVKKERTAPRRRGGPQDRLAPRERRGPASMPGRRSPDRAVGGSDALGSRAVAWQQDPLEDPEFGGGLDADDLEFVSGVDRASASEGGRPRPRQPQKRRPQVKRGSRRVRATGSPGERAEGTVRFLDTGRGFGFIRTSEGDVFFDRDSVRGGLETISRGAHVAFVFAQGERGTRADQVETV